MVYFKDLISSSSRSRYLIISDHKDGKVETKLPVGTPLCGHYAAPWPPLGNLPGLDDWTLEYHSRPPKTWVLCSPNHRTKNIASTLPCLGRRIINGETSWGDTLVLDGEFHYIPGYWEWAEDVLSRSRKTLKDARIYGAVYGSLFTYDHNTNVLHAFCEAWCPLTNTLLTSAGELSISLWDLYTIGGLPISGSPYEEVVPNVAELTGTDEMGKRFLPQACEHLFDAFHRLLGDSDNPNVPVSRWVEFWCKKALKYSQPPPRKEKKSARFKSSHNPTGVIDEDINWSPAEDSLFHKLGVDSQRTDETYLAAFLSCWLCVFVLPSKEGDFIRPGVFRIACSLACGRRISLAVPVLASIYNGLNAISKCLQLDHFRACFPIHYVYGWLAYFFRTHYLLPKAPVDPLMVAYSGEGAARYYEKEAARKRIHGGGSIVWDATLLERPHAYHYRDDGTEKDFLSSFFMSIRSNYLALRDGDAFIIEPYSPHRFSRQFGFYQDVPGRLDQDLREASLADGLRYVRICVLTKSKAKAVFPPSDSNLKKYSSANYQSWWEKAHGSFLENHMQLLVNDVGHVTDALDKHCGGLVANKAPILKSKVVILQKTKEPSYEEVQEEHTPILPSQTSNKRSSQEESTSSHGDRCWKKVRPSLDEPENANLHVVEISGDNVSPSRTLTAIKEPNNVNTLGISHQHRPRDSGESVAGPNSRKSFCASKLEQEVTSTPHGKAKVSAESNPHQQPAATMSVFDGRKVVSELKKDLVVKAWDSIRTKLASLTADRASSLKDEVQFILEDVSGMGVDISPLQTLLESFFNLAASYDQARSSLVDKAAEIEESEPYLKAKERLELALNEKNEKSGELFAACQSLEKARKKVKKFKALRDAARKEAEEVESKVSAAEEEFNKCADVSLATADATNDVQKRKQGLEATLQDLVSYKLSLD